jgi:hypothetical protein
MGSVYLAFDLKLERRVAVKIPHFDRAAQPDLLKRFHREARIAAAFNHPNLCPVYDFKQAGEVHYLTMPFLEGRPLSTFLEAGPLPQRQAVEIVRTLARALSEAHRRGVVHRDLKPANVMITPEGTLMIMDFGIARFAAACDSLHTRVGAMLGTPSYMAPEQVSGQTDAIGNRTDIYSLGVIFYQLLTGRLPFICNVNWVCVQVLHDDPMLPSELRPGLDPGIEAICLKALRKRPEERYASMDELATVLDSGSKPSRLPTAPAPVVISTAEVHLQTRRGPVPRRDLAPRRARWLAAGVVVVLSLVTARLVGRERGPDVPQKTKSVATQGRQLAAISHSTDPPPGATPEPQRNMPVAEEPAAVQEHPAAKPAVESAASTGVADVADRSDPAEPVAPEDPHRVLTRLRAELLEGSRSADPSGRDHPLWSPIHELQCRLDEPVATILIRVKKSKSNVPLIVNYRQKDNDLKTLRLVPGTVELLAVALPETLTYVLGPASSAGVLPFPPPGRPLSGEFPPPFPGDLPPPHPGGPPPHPGGPPPPPGPRPPRVRKLELKSREYVIEFSYVKGEWTHRLHVPLLASLPIPDQPT